ncbi:ABC transporter permease [Clostridiaceae bacterium NSJ-31]|uniref:ABC transporter permease n=1 Tax=Ligaoa zhengdingensis TaxID=2763658 RepID=A0A926I4W3_9FIRM|nr:ABC transporter permease [Ligaoa zhengdingensis]MBC8546903.1 ABC transporter permease [Ligaoa zhengdingensis]
MNKKKLFFLRPEFALVWIVILVYAIFSVMRPEAFLSWENLMEILRQSSSTAVLVLGVTWVISIGEIDNAFPDIAACASMLTALFIRGGMSFGVAALAAIALGVAFGALTSLLVIKFKFPSLIATIAVSGIAKAIACWIGKGIPIPVTTAGTLVYNIVWYKFLGIPVLFLLALALYAICFVVQEKTKFGQYVYAIGENPQAVRETGVKSGRIMAMVFIVAALFAAIGGVLMMGIMQSGQPKMGSSFFLDGFTVVFLGAVVFKMGKANVAGTLIGAILLGILTYGLTVVGASYFMSQIIKGTLLILGVSVVTISKNKQRGKVGVLTYE